MLGDGSCDEVCNVAECRYDEDDCQCADGCTAELRLNDVCDEECFNAECNWDDCEVCNDGCFPGWLGNGQCDDVCNVAACHYDDGDCIPELLEKETCYFMPRETLWNIWPNPHQAFEACTDYRLGDEFMNPDCPTKWLGKGETLASGMSCEDAAVQFIKEDFGKVF
jgi:hypothetical protein